tara:strand:- start:1155 stop:1916 length:762 start_codon:yes stop_codon:yes gene_type:complete
MKNMRTLPTVALALTMSAMAAVPAANAGDRNGAVVVELFTSQGCYSCPPAEKFLGELAGEKTVIALEFHVDYWDDLVHGADGKWKDPFSKPAYTQRQRIYNQQIRGTGNVYTPQMVVDGRLEAVGSRRLSVLDAIRKAETGLKERVDVGVTVASGTVEKVTLAGPVQAAGSVWLVRFIKSRETRVRSGENKGKALLSHNIVTEVQKIGKWAGRPASFAVRGFSLAEGEGCAVLVQDNRQGPIIGAAQCPAETS